MCGCAHLEVYGYQLLLAFGTDKFFTETDKLAARQPSSHSLLQPLVGGPLEIGNVKTRLMREQEV